MVKVDKLIVPPVCAERRKCVPIRGVVDCDECMIGCLYESLGELRELSDALIEQENYWQSDISFAITLDKLKSDIRALIEEIKKDGNT